MGLSGDTPSVDIVIVNWNTGAQLQDCLRSVATARCDGFHLRSVTVVDNASADGSATGLDARGLPLTIVLNRENRGFAAACNQGASDRRGTYVLFLNPDTLLFDDSLTAAVAYMEQPEHASVGICGVRLVNGQGKPVVSSARFPTPGMFVAGSLGLPKIWPAVFPPHLTSLDECQNTREVDQIIGAFFLVRRTLFHDLGGFDERFFVYFEEVDFSLRARQRGYRSVLIADAAAVHHGGTSSDQVRAARLFYSWRSRILYARKHYGPSGAAVVTLATLGLEPAARVALALTRRVPGELLDTARAYRRLVSEWWRGSRA